MAPVSTAPYRISTASDGRLLEVRRTSAGADGGDDDGTLVPLDAGSQDYCDFLTWAGVQPVAAEDLDLIEPGAEFFADADKLVARCRDAAMLLHAGWADDGGKPHLTVAPEATRALSASTPSLLTVRHADGTTATFHRLYEAVPLNPRHVAPGSDGLGSQRTRFFVARPLLDALDERLADPDDDVRRLSSLPVDRAFVFVDISEFSKYPPGQQAVIINALIKVVATPRFWNDPGGLARDAGLDQEAVMCIGDGYIFVHRGAWHAVVFAAYLAYRIEFLLAKGRIPEFHFRIGVHYGPVYRFWDIGRRDWNYIGDGIIVGQRVLGTIGKDQDDVVFLSAETRREMQANSEPRHPFTSIIRWLQNRGRRADKHGQLRRLYELNHTGYIRSVIDPAWLDATD